MRAVSPERAAEGDAAGARALAPAERSALARAMLADEAFALHFMQDIFAAGHVAGTWGDVSQRKGTHDYYNENGLEVRTWQAARTRRADGRCAHASRGCRARGRGRAAEPRAAARHAAGRPRTTNLPYTPAAPAEPEAFDVCRNDQLEPWPRGREPTPEAVQLGVEVLRLTPVPGLGEGLGAMPRFRAEVGPFIGVAGSIDARYVDGGFTGLESGSGFVGGADLSLRFGYGLDGVIGEEGDGLVYFSLGLQRRHAFEQQVRRGRACAGRRSLTAAIPARTGSSARLRMPFYLIPGDLLLMSPMYFDRPRRTEHGGDRGQRRTDAMAARLGDSLRAIPVRARARDRRDLLWTRDRTTQVCWRRAAAGSGPRVVEFKSTNFELPILEYRPYRAFDTTQSSAMIVQLFGGVDIPTTGHVSIRPAHRAQSWSACTRSACEWYSTGDITSEHRHDAACRVSTGQRHSQEHPCRRTAAQRIEEAMRSLGCHHDQVGFPTLPAICTMIRPARLQAVQGPIPVRLRRDLQRRHFRTGPDVHQAHLTDGSCRLRIMRATAAMAGCARGLPATGMRVFRSERVPVSRETKPGTPCGM